jgi:putative membrane protein
MLDAGADYQTFTKLSDGVNGSVKFIYKMDSIKDDAE